MPRVKEALHNQRARSAECIDALFWVSNHAQVWRIELGDQAFLRRIGVLELVNQEVPSASTDTSEKLVIGTECEGRQRHEVVKVECVRLGQLLFVGRENRVHFVGCCRLVGKTARGSLEE